MAKKSARKKSTAKRRTAKRAGSRRTTRSRSGELKHKPTPGLYGWITHTELQSADPLATKTWCAKVLGWTFTQSVPMPGGEYHLFAYAEKGGGGIRATTPSEPPHSTFTAHAADCQESFAKALTEGAEPAMPPPRQMPALTITM